MNPGIGKTTKHKYWKEAVETVADDPQAIEPTVKPH
jgi:D-lactate dehydrogenase